MTYELGHTALSADTGKVTFPFEDISKHKDCFLIPEACRFYLARMKKKNAGSRALRVTSMY